MRELTSVVAFTRQVNIVTLGDVIEQAIVSANDSLKEEFLDRINKVSNEIASIKQQNEGANLKSDSAELQKELNLVKQLALDYHTQLKKFDAYLKENVQATPKKTLRERIFGKKK